MEGAGQGGGGGGGPSGGNGGGADGAGGAASALQSGAAGQLPTLERTFNLMQGVQGNCILVSRRQEGNPVLRHVRNVRWQFADIVPDYILGNGTAALYISVRYHLLHPEYLFLRIRELQKSFRLRLVLCHVDSEDMVKALGEINKTAVQQACTLVCAWSPEEAARYLETFKLYEHKTAEGIQERTEHDYTSRLAGALTTIKGVNKVDVVTLGSTFGTLAALMGATAEQLAACPGLGPTKVRRIHDTFHAPFRRTARQLRIQDAVRDGGAGATAVAPGAQRPLPAQEHVDGAGSTAAPEVQEPQQQQAEGVTDADAAAYDDVYYGDEDLGAGGGEDGFEDDEGDAQLYASAELSDEDALGV